MGKEQLVTLITSIDYRRIIGTIITGSLSLTSGMTYSNLTSIHWSEPDYNANLPHIILLSPHLQKYHGTQSAAAILRSDFMVNAPRQICWSCSLIAHFVTASRRFTSMQRITNMPVVIFVVSLHLGIGVEGYYY